MGKLVKVPKELFDENGNKWVFDKMYEGFADSTRMFSYKVDMNGYLATHILRICDIEKKFKKDKRRPASPGLIRQGYYECAAASMAMITKIPLERVKEALVKHGWVVENGVGFALQKKVLRELGFSSMFHEKKPNQECLAIVPSLNVKTKRHQVYWNGKEILDPQFENQALWYGPDWGLDEIGALYFLTVSPLNN